MYRKIDRKLKYCKYFIDVANVLLILLAVVVFCLIVYLIFIQKSKSLYIKNSSQIPNIMNNVKIQSYESNNKLVVITADRATIKDKGTTANNVKLNSASLKVKSTLVEFDEKSNEIILKNRPKMIFYGERDN